MTRPKEVAVLEDALRRATRLSPHSELGKQSLGTRTITILESLGWVLVSKNDQP